jgi:hypothetical protein
MDTKSIKAYTIAIPCLAVTFVCPCTADTDTLTVSQEGSRILLQHAVYCDLLETGYDGDCEDNLKTSEQNF